MKTTKTTLDDASPGSVAVVGEDGWRSAGEPPDTDRLVEIAWEDGSHGNPTLGFYDGIAETPDSNRRWWWQYHFMHGMDRVPAGGVLAWRERHSAARAQLMDAPRCRHGGRRVVSTRDMNAVAVRSSNWISDSGARTKPAKPHTL